MAKINNIEYDTEEKISLIFNEGIRDINHKLIILPKLTKLNIILSGYFPIIIFEKNEIELELNTIFTKIVKNEKDIKDNYIILKKIKLNGNDFVVFRQKLLVSCFNSEYINCKTYISFEEI